MSNIVNLSEGRMIETKPLQYIFTVTVEIMSSCIDDGEKYLHQIMDHYSKYDFEIENGKFERDGVNPNSARPMVYTIKMNRIVRGIHNPEQYRDVIEHTISKAFDEFGPKYSCSSPNTHETLYDRVLWITMTYTAEEYIPEPAEESSELKVNTHAEYVYDYIVEYVVDTTVIDDFNQYWLGLLLYICKQRYEIDPEGLIGKNNKIDKLGYFDTSLVILDQISPDIYHVRLHVSMICKDNIVKQYIFEILDILGEYENECMCSHSKFNISFEKRENESDPKLYKVYLRGTVEMDDSSDPKDRENGFKLMRAVFASFGFCNVEYFISADTDIESVEQSTMVPNTMDEMCKLGIARELPNPRTKTTYHMEYAMMSIDDPKTKQDICDQILHKCTEMLVKYKDKVGGLKIVECQYTI